MYSSGQGVLQDFSEAFKWYRLAADHGGGRSHEALANAYAKGEGIAKNLVVAYALYNLRKNDDTFVLANLASLTPDMTQLEIKVATALSDSMAKPCNLLTVIDEYIASAPEFLPN